MSFRFETERLLLREAGFRDGRAAAAYYLRNREFLSPWEPLHDADFFTASGQRRLMRADRRGRRNDAGLRLWIYLKEDQSSVPVGNIAISNVVRGAFESCFLGYRLDEKESGKGYMTEAVRKMVEIAFSRFELHRVEANVMPRNTASIRVLEHCGFHLEGLSEKYLSIAGRWEDHLRYARIRSRPVVDARRRS